MDRSPFISTRPLIVGVLNVTPDSFSDGGAYPDPAAAVARGLEMVRQGADVLDIGGESTRPGSQPVAAEEQSRRVLPAIERLTLAMKPAGAERAAISIDTTSAAVAEAALDRGATIVNDTSAALDDPAMLPLVARRGAAIILMHRLDKPAVMQRDPRYTDVVAEVLDHLLERANAAEQGGVARDRIAIDPGIGFGKTTRHNLELLAHLDRFVATGYPVMLGASRKRFLGEVTGITNPAQRDAATAAVTAIAARAGVLLHRVHEVPMNRAAADLGWAIRGGERTAV